MTFIIGLTIVISSILVGYKLSQGNFLLLWQPAEFIIIFGTTLGISLISTPFHFLKRASSSIRYIFFSRVTKKQEYIKIIIFFFSIFRLAKSKGIIEIEKNISAPYESILFQDIKFLFKDKTSINFIISSLRLITMGISSPSNLQELMKKQIKIYQEENESYCHFFSYLSDSLPALGIVAAVLGIIVAMKSISESQGVLGTKIAAALVGTFLGILFAYTLISPIANFLMIRINNKIRLLHSMRIGMFSYLQGNSPIVIAEIMRQSIEENQRPSFDQINNAINNAIKENK